MSGPAIEGEVLPPAPAEDAAPQVVTLSCDQPGCFVEFTGPAGGKGSAPMLLGRHRWSVHQISSKGKGKARGSGPAQPVELSERHPVVGTVAEAAAQVKGTGAPRAGDLSKALGRGLSVATLMAAGWAVDSDPAIRAAAANPQTAETAAQQKLALTRLLSVSDDAATRIAQPLGRLIAPTQINRKYGRALVENSDLGPAVAELVDVGRAWAQFLAVRREHVRELRAARLAAAQDAAGPVTFVPPVVPDVFDGAAPPPAPAGPIDGSPLGAGRVATPTYRTA